MEIFGVGPLEFILLLVLALVILGPQDMVGTARKIGQWVYRVVRSPTWRSIMETSQDLRELPTKIVRDAGLEETMKEIKETANEVKTDLSDTSREISSEMQAATSEVNREMQTAVQNANAGMKEASTEAQIAMQSTADGLSGSENTIAPPQGQVEAAVEVEASPLEESMPAPKAEPVLTPYEVQLGAIATGLGGKEIHRTDPEENTIFRVVHAKNAVPAAPPAGPQAEAPARQPYAARLDTFAQALGAITGAPKETQEPSSPPWAIGIPVGLNLNTGGGMEGALKNRMEEMMKSIEKLESKTRDSTGGEETSPTSPMEENISTFAQADSHENSSEPAATPARTRRNAKRPLEAKAAPTAEAADEGEVLKTAPRKRASKKTPSPAEADTAETSKTTPRKRAAKTTLPKDQTAQDETPKAAPRKRTAKNTPTETAAQDSSSAQA